MEKINNDLFDKARYKLVLLLAVNQMTNEFLIRIGFTLLAKV